MAGVNGHPHVYRVVEHPPWALSSSHRFVPFHFHFTKRRFGFVPRVLERDIAKFTSILPLDTHDAMSEKQFNRDQERGVYLGQGRTQDQDQGQGSAADTTSGAAAQGTPATATATAVPLLMLPGASSGLSGSDPLSLSVRAYRDPSASVSLSLTPRSVAVRNLSRPTRRSIFSLSPLLK